MFNRLSNIVSRKDLVIIASWTASGIVLQIVCKRYLKYLEKNPEISGNTNNLENPPQNLNSKRKIPLIWLRNRGGQIFEIVGFKTIINLNPIITFVARKGALSFLSGGLIRVFGPRIVASKALSTWIYKGLPYSYSTEEMQKMEREMKRWITADVGKDQIIDNRWIYFFKFLGNPEIDYATKLEKANVFLKRQLNFNSKGERILFVLLLVFFFCGLFFLDVNNGFYALMEALLKALREGRLSKRIARAIIRKLKRKGIPVDEELVEIAYN